MADAVCRPHFMEVAIAAFAFVGGIVAGGLLLGFLNTDQNFQFKNVATGNLVVDNVITPPATNPAPIIVESVSGAVGGTTACMSVAFPTEVDLTHTKMSESSPPGQGFLAAGIIAIIAGAIALVHLGHLVHLRWRVA